MNGILRICNIASYYVLFKALMGPAGFEPATDEL